MKKAFEKKICVLGLGYIGLPTASLLATRGFQVLGVDVQRDRVEQINQGKLPISEPGLDALFRSAVFSKRLEASTKAVPSDVFILALPTPLSKNRTADLSSIDDALESIASLLEPENLIIIESTIPPGTTEKVAGKLKKLRPDIAPDKLHIAHSPERVLPSQILKELIENDRVVGGLTTEAGALAAEFYRSFIQGEVHITDAKTAEITKLVENSFRDVNIAFANELSLICEELGVSVWEVVEMANRHPRVNILKPGPGVGGHCIAVDPWFLIQSSPENSKLMRVAREQNDSKPGKVINRIQSMAESLDEPVLGFLGLSYKANTSDLRESPALEIVEHFKDTNCLVVEPNIEALPESLHTEGVRLVDLDTALEKANLLVLLVDHREFIAVENLRLQEKLILDTRGAWS